VDTAAITAITATAATTATMATAMEQSPTKQITERLSRLNLYSGEASSAATTARSQSETLTSAKNHLHIPQLIFNKQFADESKVGENTEFVTNIDGGDVVDSDSTVEEEQDDTVIHNTENADNTLPDWMAVKLNMQTNEAKAGIKNKSGKLKPKLVNNHTEYKSSTHLKPRLVNSVTDSESESDMFKNETWEEMKKQYGIAYSDDSSSSPSSSSEDDDHLLHNANGNEYINKLQKERQFNDTSAYSFQDMDEFRMISSGNQFQSSNDGTKKVTSFKSNYIDSPIAPPKIIKSLDKPKAFLTEIPESQSINTKKTTNNNLINQKLFNNNNNNSNNNNNGKAIVQLITPVEQNMKFDADEGKWVFPHERNNLKEQKKNDNNNDDENNLIIEDEIEKPIIKISEPNILNNNNNNNNNSMKNTTFEFDAQQVTNISQLDVSFSESRKFLISVLTSVIKLKTNWDNIDKIDISNKRLITVKNLEEFLPNLKEVKLDFNKLTTIEGLSSNLEEISLSNNKIGDHFLNFKSFIYLKKLNISFNHLINMKIFQDLKNLRELNISNNSISNFVELPFLQILNLSNNEIKGDLNFKNFKFPNLQELDLSNNKLNKVIINNLKNLRIFKLKNNKLLETLKFDSNLLKLKKINLIGNKNLKKIEIGKNLQNLKILSFEGTIKIIGEFPNLEILKINNNNNNDDNNFEFNNKSLIINKNLKSIILNNCLINFEILMKLKLNEKFPFLQKINLCNNKLDGNYINLILFFKKFKNLQEIKLDNNPIIENLNTEYDKKLFKLMIKKLMNE